MRILVAEDDFASRLLLQKTMQSFGEVHLASNGREAIEAVNLSFVKKEPYEVIFLDIMMPDMDGLATLRKIRRIEEARDVPADKRSRIIMTTALADRKTVMKAVEGQCDGYLVKPIRPDMVVGRLRMLGLPV
jgi:two-component system chemotaxis response regulator CheY